MINNLKILYHQGKQYIPDVRSAMVPGIFRGRPVLTSSPCDETLLASVCPAGAILTGPLGLDLGRCVFCGECAFRFPDKIKFTKDYRIAANVREQLIIREGNEEPVRPDPARIRNEIRRIFSGSLKLRQVSAGGDNSTEMELNAAGNVNFDMGRFGIEFVASPRHADGVVVTGPVTANMATALKMTWEAMPDPKLLILAGTDAISGGIFTDSPALDRSFLNEHPVDLYVPGNPVHPLTFINGVLDLIRSGEKRFLKP